MLSIFRANISIISILLETLKNAFSFLRCFNVLTCLESWENYWECKIFRRLNFFGISNH